LRIFCQLIDEDCEAIVVHLKLDLGFDPLPRR
jgi:hypothetical protein